MTVWLNVSLQTDYEGQAKKLMELMEQTDMLIVAGGDGTMQEVVTGLLRRPDQVCDFLLLTARKCKMRMSLSDGCFMTTGKSQ